MVTPVIYLLKTILLFVGIGILSGCSFKTLSHQEALDSLYWEVQGGGEIGHYTRLWLAVDQTLTATASNTRTVIIQSPQRRQRTISLNSQGNVAGFLQETLSNARVEDSEGDVYGTLRLFSSRYYEDGADTSLFLDRLNEEMDRELSRRLQSWLRGKDFRTLP